MFCIFLHHLSHYAITLSLFVNAGTLVSYIPQQSVCISAIEIYTLLGEESLFTEESRNSPCESTGSQESSKSLFPIKCLHSIQLACCIILQVTHDPDIIQEAEWQSPSGAWWWWKWRHRRALHPICHWSGCFESPTGHPTARQGMLGQVITNNPDSSSKETELCWYLYCLPSAVKFPKSSWGNATTIAAMAKVNCHQEIMQLWPCTPLPGAPAAQVCFRQEVSSTQGQWRSKHSPTHKSYFGGSEKVHGGNYIPKDYLANII